MEVFIPTGLMRIPMERRMEPCCLMQVLLFCSPSPQQTGYFLKSGVGWPKWQQITNNDIPQIGMQPVYLARFNANGAIVSDEYNPFAIKTGFSRTDVGLYALNLDQASTNFVCSPTIIASGELYYAITSEFTGNNINLFCTSISGAAADTAGQIILYKVV